MIYNQYYIIRFETDQLGLYSNFNFGNTTQSDYVEHIVVDGDTLFTIANKYYQNTTRWVLIAEYNVLADPIELAAGSIINVPTL